VAACHLSGTLGNGLAGEMALPRHLQAMRRFTVTVQAFLVLILLGAPSASGLAVAPAPGMRDAAPYRAPVLTVSGASLRWSSLPRIRQYLLAATSGHRTKLRVVSGTRFAPPPTPGHQVAYMVRARARDARWSRSVDIRWPQITHAPDYSDRLKVSVENTTGWGVDSIFYDAGVRYERLDVGDGSNLSLVAKALSNGMIPLVLYNPGSASLRGVSPSRAAADIVSLAQRLTVLAAEYPILTKLNAIEFGNEVYRDESVTEYAAQYDAAHRALAESGLSSWKLLAVATAVCGSMHATDWIPEFIRHLSGGAAEVDGWTVHPYGSMTTDHSPDCSGPHGYGWPDVRDWHQIAVSQGSYAPWYVTEVGQCISAGSACPHVVSPATQAADLTRYLNAAASYPWVAFFNWYASCDDSSGGYGLLAENSSGVCGADGAADQRPAFRALASWIAANGEG
jgi:hypothetical protein